MGKIGIFLMFLTLIGNFLGLFREIIIAYLYGASEISDAYNVSLLLSEILISWFSAILGTSFIPMYLNLKAENKIEAKYFKDNLFWSTILFGTFIAFISFYFLNDVVNLVAPGFNADQTKLALKLSYIMIPSVIFSGVLGILTGLYHSHNEFKIPSYSGITFNLSIITFSLILSKLFGVLGLGISYLIANVTRFLYLLIFLKKVNIRINSKFSFRPRYLKEMFIISLPLILSIFLSQIQAVLDRNFASFLIAGSTSALYYARKVADVPVQVIGGVISTLIFPIMTKNIAQKKYDEGIKTLKNAIFLNLALLIPITFILYENSYFIIKIIYNYGTFDSNALKLTESAFKIFALGLLWNSLYMSFVKYFYAKKKMYIPLISTAFSLVIYYFSVNVLINMYDHLAIPIASVISIVVSNLIFFMFFKRDTFLNKDNLLILMTNICIVIFITILEKILNQIADNNTILIKVFCSIIYIVVYMLFLSKNNNKVMKDLKRKFFNKQRG